MENKKSSLPVTVLVAVLCVVIGVLIALLFARQNVQDVEPVEVELPSVNDDMPELNVDTSGLKVGYAVEGVTVVDNQNELQAAFEEAVKNANENRIALWYKNDAYSDDGQNFNCFLGNSVDNMFDMFFDIYYDSEMQDEIFLSELIRPGTAFEHITLNRALEQGTHRVYCVQTLVKTDNNEQAIAGQLSVTIDLHVGE